MARKYEHHPYRFPAIHEAIQERGGVNAFCKARYFSATTYYTLQHGSHEPTLPMIMEILDYTGLTFEEAFLNKKSPGSRYQHEPGKTI